MNKLRRIAAKLSRIWRAFCAGFWRAWMEVPPSHATHVGELTVKLTCDSTQFTESLDEAILKLIQLRHEARGAGMMKGTI